MTKIWFRVLAVFCFTLLLATGSPIGLGNISAHAQLAPTTEEAAKPKPAVDPFGRLTPRSSVEGFLSAVRQEDFEKAARYLDLSQIPEAERRLAGRQRASELLQLLDRDGFINEISALSAVPEGRLDDELEANVEQVGVIDRSSRNVPVTMHRVESEGGLKVWLFEPSLINRVPFLIQVSQEGLLDRILPQTLKDNKIGTVAIGHWLGLIAAALAALAIGYVFAWMIVSVLRAILRRRSDLPGHGILASIMIPIAVVIGVFLYRHIVIYMGVQVVARDSISWMATVASWMSIAWLGMRIIDGIADFARYSMSRTNRITSVAVIMLARRMAKAVVLAIAGITILDIFGVDVTTGLAALGIGGLALALGAQKTIENLVGSITVVADKPVRVGDFCKFGDVMGTVEDIGIRSTQVRTLDRTIVTVPNGAFASMQIENYAVRDQFKLQTTLGMRYETTQDQIRYLLMEIRKLLDGHDSVLPNSLRVRFIGLNSSSIDIEVFCYIKAKDYNGFLEVQESVLLSIMGIVQTSGTQFAFPSQTVYFGKDGPPLPSDAEKIGKIVNQLDNAGELPLPKFEINVDDTVEKMVKAAEPAKATKRKTPARSRKK